MNRSMQFTEDCTDRHEFLSMLAGLSLLFPNAESADKVQTDKLFNDINELKKRAEQAYKFQINEEQQETSNKEITSTLCRLNEYQDHFGYNGTTSNKTTTSAQAREKRLLLVRSVIFEKWLLSERKNMIKLREHVLEQMNQREATSDDDSSNGGESSEEEHGNDASSELPLHPKTPGPQTAGDGSSTLCPKKNFRKRLLGRPRSDRKSNNDSSIYAPSKR